MFIVLLRIKTLELELKTLRTNVEHLLGHITELESKVERVQEVLPVSSDTGRDMNVVTPSVSPAENIAVIGEKNACGSYADMAAQEQLKQLQSQVQSLSSKQTQLELEKERERRICNVLIGNLHEGEDESEDELNEKVVAVFTDHLKIKLQPSQSWRVGKKSSSKGRLVLVKLKSVKDKFAVLKAAKQLQKTSLFIMEDLSKSDREQRKILVAAMKKAREEGKRAFIRFFDGKLVINGEVVDCPPVNSSEIQFNTSQ